MRKLVPLSVVAAVALAALGGTLASASGTQTMTFVATENPKSEIVVDVGKKGDSDGDSVFFSETLRQGGKKVGRTDIMCTFTRAIARCYGTLSLPGGTIEAGGGIRFAKTFPVAILGGTGTYAGASGVVRYTELSDTRSRVVVELAG